MKSKILKFKVLAWGAHLDLEALHAGLGPASQRSQGSHHPRLRRASTRIILYHIIKITAVAPPARAVVTTAAEQGCAQRFIGYPSNRIQT